MAAKRRIGAQRAGGDFQSAYRHATPSFAVAPTPRDDHGAARWGQGETRNAALAKPAGQTTDLREPCLDS